MSIFEKFGKNKNAGMLDDISYIQEMKHIQGQWQQYDFLLAAQGYGWDYALDCADYMTKADLSNIGTVSVSSAAGGEDVEHIAEYNAAGRSIKALSALKQEAGMLGVGGISKVVGAPVKIVWINQSRVIRLFTPVDDEDMMLRYMETVIRRTFGTKDEMKMARKPQ